VFHNKNVVVKYIHLTTQSSQTLGYISSYYIFKNSCSDFASLYNVTFETYFVNMLKVCCRHDVGHSIINLLQINLFDYVHTKCGSYVARLLIASCVSY
jgi:hypothetical protein